MDESVKNIEIKMAMNEEENWEEVRPHNISQSELLNKESQERSPFSSMREVVATERRESSVKEPE